MQTIEEMNAYCRESLIGHLGIEITELAEGHVTASMPVDKRTIQPIGLLHGGATLALAETIAGIGSVAIVDAQKYGVVGMEVNGNHIGNTDANHVIGTATLLHRGRRTHVWDVRVVDENKSPISICRVTNMIIKKKE
jgi:uncharacterized protein (TIGR00369 family)